MSSNNRIKFTHSGHAHAVGNFQAGDIFTGDPALCRHYVEEAGCAEWAPLPPPAADAPAADAPAADAPAADAPAAAPKPGRAKR
ncbi:MAG: hypothetical protein O9341_06885 [Paucibacter sp.]|nr:hypothetical protein [Roseateles sp.]